MKNTQSTAPATILTESINTMIRLGDDKFVSLEFIGIGETERQKIIGALFDHLLKERENISPNNSQKKLS